MKKKVTVLLSTYNGELYLRQQLDSLLNQKDIILDILVRDDGSTDNTIKILEEYKNKNKLDWYTGENLKPAKSFMDLIFKAKESDYYAFCDQDDFWLDDKLIIAVKELEKYPTNEPCLYYGSQRLVDSNLNPLKKIKRSNQRMLNFSSAIINSNAAGCTMVFNYSLLKYVRKKKPEYIFMHDAWLHKLCIILGGHLVYDDDVHLLYRQHQNNVIGAGVSKKGRIIKHYKSFKERPCIRSNIIISLYDCYSDYMNEEDRKMCELVYNYKKNLICRFKLLFDRKIKTNYIMRNIYYKFSVLFGFF